ncbi:MAG: Na/Pi cotransporter family protein [Planctomycetes bacterium]|nr:Na/Pi cotransporter family protein [Planctomycetota bacterium]MCP4771723.1 Na/Pi cotransporter family protein [Planctomycetota bacterium]MCP4859977.1 Na/Pi cotransporter family protein [Planctomycetota bacterium]
MLANLATASVANDSIETFPLLMGLFGGLALFLFGMEQMATALKVVAGARMKKVLARLTTNRFMGVLTGAFVTTVIQSSSVTTVLVVGFISADLMSMAQSVGVIMGANIGTTVTAQIIAFKVTKYSLLLVAFGFGLSFISKNPTVKHNGQGLLGLGLIFLGMAVMGEAMAPLRTYAPFIDMMVMMEQPLKGILFGAAFTALVQSSSATTGVVIVMASQGLISLPAGIALSFGANIGTCVTALLAAIGKPREGLRAAVVHVLFNVLGVLVWIAFIPELAEFVRGVSPAFADRPSADRLAMETPRQIANAHTVFNVANTFIFIWFAPLFARVVQWMVPDRPLAEAEKVKAKYLDSELLDTPSLALDRSRLELVHMGDSVRDMYAAIIPAALTGTAQELSRIEAMDDRVDALHGFIVTYLGRISRRELSEEQTDEMMRLMETANDLENIGDIIETNLVMLGRERLAKGVTISEPTVKVITDFHAAIGTALDSAFMAVIQVNAGAADRVIMMKAEINRLSGTAAKHEAQRLVVKEPNRLAAYTTEMDILENLKRVYYFCRRMARASVS